MRLFENPELLAAHFRNGMMMLPYYHYNIVSKLNEQGSFGVIKEGLARKERIMNLFRGLKHLTLRKSKIIIFSHTALEIKKGEQFFNSLHGYYYDLYKDSTLLIEDASDGYVWRTETSCSQLSFINTYLLLLAGLLSGLLQRIHPLHSGDYQKFIAAYPDLFSKEGLSRADYFIRVYAFLLRLLFRLVAPKVIMVNCGSYGGNMAIVCYVAKQLGIKVIEAQHGSIYNNLAYEVSSIVRSSAEYKEYLPDVFFAFGDYWSKFVKWDFEKFPVGNPYLNEYVHTDKKDGFEYDFLVISQPLDEIFEGFNKAKFVKDLSNTFPESHILFRIHPAEYLEEQKEIYHGFKNVDVVSASSVLYEDMKKCHHIIGWYSTCLFEALAFNKIPIIIDTEPSREFFPHEVGIWVKSPADLMKLDLSSLGSSVNSTYYFATGFEENVRKYLDKLL